MLTLGVIVLAFVIGFGQRVFGGYLTLDVPNITPGTFQMYEFFASSTAPTTVATTTTATSTNIIPYYDAQGRYNDGAFKIAGAKKVTVYFGRAWDSAGNSGSSAFKVEVSPDGTNWYAWNKLSQNVATSTSEWQVGTVTISAATSTSVMGIDLSKNTFRSLRCVVTETTDGAHRCFATAEF